MIRFICFYPIGCEISALKKIRITWFQNFKYNTAIFVLISPETNYF
jgi:hypothetical protein